MVLRGRVSSIEVDGRVRVTFPGRDNTVSAPLPAAVHVGLLTIGQTVIVVFHADNLRDGTIIAKL